ncbi:MAG TPA: DNA-processing protein DprA [Gemmatimonadales bacterium]|nr:DNA-processing protein DprA [Gemmatimonadales bacterium]
MDDARAAWVALALVPGIGAARLHSLLAACQTPLGALSAPFALLRAVPGMTPAAATAVAAASVDQGRRLLEQVERCGGRALLPIDPDFPELLRHIPDPPTLLFAAGRLGLLALPAVAIVGSRKHSAYGAEACRLVAWEAARAGVVVASGMARGLDALAHQAALDAGGGTVGVLGNGLGVVYPAANRRLYQRVVAEGLLLTEFPPGERPSAGSFPRRNRIISGLARVTVVVEAGEASGALITAGTALEQGREVMALPGPIISPLSVGANRLIRDGAAPLLEPRDLLDHYPDARPPAGAPCGPPGGASLRPLPDSLSETERSVAELLSGEPAPVDELIGRSGRRPAELLAALSALEIAGVAEQRPGRRFARV